MAKHAKTDLIRWAFVVPAAACGWYAALVGGLLTLGLLQGLCPPTKVVSGVCVADWWNPVEDGAIIFFTGLSAFLVVTAAALVAPTHKKVVAFAVYVVGVGIATVILLEDAGIWLEYVSALMAGGAACYLFARKHGDTRNVPERSGYIPSAPPDTN